MQRGHIRSTGISEPIFDPWPVSLRQVRADCLKRPCTLCPCLTFLSALLSLFLSFSLFFPFLLAALQPQLQIQGADRGKWLQHVCFTALAAWRPADVRVSQRPRKAPPGTQSPQAAPLNPLPSHDAYVTGPAPLPPTPPTSQWLPKPTHIRVFIIIDVDTLIIIIYLLCYYDVTIVSPLPLYVHLLGLCVCLLFVLLYYAYCGHSGVTFKLFSLCPCVCVRF